MSGLDPQAAAYVASLQAAPPYWETGIEAARAGYEAGAIAGFGGLDEVASVEDADADGVPVRVYRPAADGPLPLVVYHHGGGWVIGSRVTHDPLCRAFAARTPCVLVSVDYRLAPEHPFPAAVDDAWTAFRWAAGRAAALGGDPARLAAAGDSAGGNLAAVVALRARDAGIALGRQLLLYPVVDHDFESDSYRELGEGLNLTRAAMEWFWGHYLAGADGSQPDASPLRAASLAGTAPAFVHVCGFDPLRSEGEAYAARLASEGVPVELRTHASQIHGFLRLPALIDAATGAIEEVCASIRTI